MTNSFTFVHSVVATGMRRLPSGTVSVDLGTSAGLLFDDDDQFRKFIADLTDRHDALITAEYVDATEGGPNAVAALNTEVTV